MIPDRLLAQIELARDLGDGIAVNDALEDLALPIGQGVDQLLPKARDGLIRQGVGMGGQWD